MVIKRARPLFETVSDITWFSHYVTPFKVNTGNTTKLPSTQTMSIKSNIEDEKAVRVHTIDFLALLAVGPEQGQQQLLTKQQTWWQEVLTDCKQRTAGSGLQTDIMSDVSSGQARMSMIPRTDILCRNGCGFFGNQEWQWYCSLCWREHSQKPLRWENMTAFCNSRQTFSTSLAPARYLCSSLMGLFEDLLLHTTFQDGMVGSFRSLRFLDMWGHF